MTSSAVRLFVEQHGSGEPTIVFLHGFAGSARNFRPQVRALKVSHRVVSFDLRGHARSEAPLDPNAYETTEFVEDVLRVLHEVNADRCVLVGLSMGAHIALRFALSHPEYTEKLVLVSLPSGEPKSIDWANAFADTIERFGLERAGERFVWNGDRFDEEAKRLIKLGFLEHSPYALVAILRKVLATIPPVASTPGIADLRVPTLVVAGKKDEASLHGSRRFASLQPRRELLELEDVGHIPNLENPQLFNDIIEHFSRAS